MSVLVVLVNYNSPEDTYRCLKSLAQSTLPPKVVVVDNGSVAAGRLVEEHAKECYRDTHVIFNPHNDGFGGGNNIGLEWGLANSQAEYFFILNNDTVVLPESIAELAKHLENNLAVGMCSPAIFRFNEPNIYWFGGGYIDWKKGGAISPNINRPENRAFDIADSTFITGCAMFLRREVLIKVGGFSEDYFMYSEDIDYCQRVLNAGYKIDYLLHIRILHDAHSSIMKNNVTFVPPQHWSNPNLGFVLKNIVYGTLLNLKKHATGSDRFVGTAWVLTRYFKWSLSYIRHKRVDALRAIYTGIICSVSGKRPV